jgi:hypothetical protein
LLAAIPNHRAPVVEGVAAEPGREAQGTDHLTVPSVNTDETKSHEKGATRDLAQRQATAPKTGDSKR